MTHTHTDEIRTLSIVRSVAELAEDRAALLERVRRLEAANVELQAEVEKQRAAAELWHRTVESLRGQTEA